MADKLMYQTNDARDVVVVQTTKLNMDCKPRLGIPKKETQDLVRRPAKGLELAVNVLKESIVVAAKAQVMVVAKCIGQAFACPDLPTVLIQLPRSRPKSWPSTSVSGSGCEPLDWPLRRP